MCRARSGFTASLPQDEAGRTRWRPPHSSQTSHARGTASRPASAHRRRPEGRAVPSMSSHTPAAPTCSPILTIGAQSHVDVLRVTWRESVKQGPPTIAPTRRLPLRPGSTCRRGAPPRVHELLAERPPRPRTSEIPRLRALRRRAERPAAAPSAGPSRGSRRARWCWTSPHSGHMPFSAARVRRMVNTRTRRQLRRHQHMSVQDTTCERRHAPHRGQPLAGRSARTSSPSTSAPDRSSAARLWMHAPSRWRSRAPSASNRIVT